MSIKILLSGKIGYITSVIRIDPNMELCGAAEPAWQVRLRSLFGGRLEAWIVEIVDLARRGGSRLGAGHDGCQRANSAADEQSRCSS